MSANNYDFPSGDALRPATSREKWFIRDQPEPGEPKPWLSSTSRHLARRIRLVRGGPGHPRQPAWITSASACACSTWASPARGASWSSPGTPAATASPAAPSALVELIRFRERLMDQSKLRPQTLDPNRPFDFSQASLQDYHRLPPPLPAALSAAAALARPQAEPLRENEAPHPPRRAFPPPGPAGPRSAFRRAPGRMVPPPPTAETPAFARWWENFTALLPALEGKTPRRRSLLAAPLGSHRLLAKYDLMPGAPRRARWSSTTGKRISSARAAPAWKRACKPWSTLHLLPSAGGRLSTAGQPFARSRSRWCTGSPSSPTSPNTSPYTPQNSPRDGRSLDSLVG